MGQEIAAEAIVHYDENGDGVVLVAKGDVIPDHVRALLAGASNITASAVVPAAATVPEAEPLEAMNVKELKAIAAADGVDLAGATRRADILDLIVAAHSGEEAMKPKDTAQNKARSGAANKGGVKGPVDADTSPDTSDASSVATGDTKE